MIDALANQNKEPFSLALLVKEQGKHQPAPTPQPQ